MAATTPFAPKVVSSLAGFTVSVASSSAGVSSQVTISASTVSYAPNFLVVAQGSAASSIPVFFRMVAGATATATATDTPIIVGQPPRLFANPNPLGQTAIAVICTLTTVTLFVTPGEGGID